MDYLRCILLCNSIVIDKGQFKCDSPDELCLVEYCKYLGGELLAKDGSLVTISLFGQQELWEISKQLEFTSERKRMSVLAMNLTQDRYLLFSKVILFSLSHSQGADDMILARSLKSGTMLDINLEENYLHITDYLQKYADKGLRTLVMAMKELEEDTYNNAVKAINKAETVMENRDEVKAEWYTIVMFSDSQL